MGAAVDTSTSLRGRDLPGTSGELARAHIAADTPVEIRIEDERVSYRSVDSMERIEDEHASRRLSGDEFLESLDRIVALAPGQD